MLERIPIEPENLPDTPRRRRAKDAFVDAFLDVARWEAAGDDRSALTLLGEMIVASVDAGCLEGLTARMRDFLDNEAVRRDFMESLGDDSVRFGKSPPWAIRGRR